MPTTAALTSCLQVLKCTQKQHLEAFSIFVGLGGGGGRDGGVVDWVEVGRGRGRR